MLTRSIRSALENNSQDLQVFQIRLHRDPFPVISTFFQAAIFLKNFKWVSLLVENYAETKNVFTLLIHVYLKNAPKDKTNG